jgi:2-octaprenyl-6-methoxyphenol hydroxylase
MNICLIGDSLTSLVLAKVLTNKSINVFLYYEKKKFQNSQSRTIGISKNNFDFIENEIIKLNKDITWKINNIEIYSEKLREDRLLNFKKDKKDLFLMVKNNIFYELLNSKLNKDILFKKILIRNNKLYEKIIKNKNYDLIINCDSNNKIAKKYFNKKIEKNYNSNAYTTILSHKKIKNNKAIQVFTKYGPLAFLPLSNTKTSIVFSIKKYKDILTDSEILKLIKEYNQNYQIKSLEKIENFKLNFSLARNYYYKNIMAFGENLHKIHPLAGQGFNMTLRDIKKISKIIQNRIELGLKIDSSICKQFEKESRNANFIFAHGIDFIHEFFDLNKNNKNIYFDKILQLLGKNKFFTNILSKKADRGFSI